MPSSETRQRRWVRCGLYFVCGPLLGLPLFVAALFLGLTGPPSWKLTVLGAMAGYLGLWLAVFEARGSRGVRANITSVLLVVGLLALGPYAIQVSQVFLHPPVALKVAVAVVFFLAPIAVACHYLISRLLSWRTRGISHEVSEAKSAAP
jgi:putative flippase GtrA